MLKPVAALAIFALSASALAQGPGTRLRTGPGPQQPGGPVERDAQRCDTMQGAAKERCLRELRAAMRGPGRDPHEGPGPEALGGTPAGTGATSGTAGGSSVGAPAPR
jgi:hypothetical protein